MGASTSGRVSSFDHTLFCLNAKASIREAMALINRNQAGIALVVNDSERLISAFTDGDIRRALLKGCTLTTTLAETLIVLAGVHPAEPVHAPNTASPEEILTLMKRRKVRQIPLVDSAGRVTELLTIDDLLTPNPIGCRALLMAGGFGSRLRPLSEHTIKPMLPVSGRPLLDLTVRHLAACGIQDLCISVHYQAEQIRSYFKDPDSWGVDITFIEEHTPLGTAGAVGLLSKKDLPLLVMNADVLCRVNVRRMFEQHQFGNSDLTVGVTIFEQQVPYGVVQADGRAITGIVEKPTSRFEINAGVYLLSPRTQALVGENEEVHMTEILNRAFAKKFRAEKFLIEDLWLDIGDFGRYLEAQSVSL
ncbi:MAG: sugar phosphate nucleotidyltransferase [Bdellovibrionota bacterium]